MSRKFSLAETEEAGCEMNGTGRSAVETISESVSSMLLEIGWKRGDPIGEISFTLIETDESDVQRSSEGEKIFSF